MNILFRADDLGFSEAVNYGILKTIQEGPIRNVGLMTNMTAASHGFACVKDLNIALGQHTNISVGKPLCPPELIPSLVNQAGEFHSSKDIHARPVDTIDIHECELEIEAQLKRFIEITGRRPDYFEGHAVFSKNFFIALENVAKRHQLFYCNPIDPQWLHKLGLHEGVRQTLQPGGVYDPYAYVIEDNAKIAEHDRVLLIFHPGYIDQYLMTKSSFNLIRPIEVEFLTSSRLKDWMHINQVSLLDFRSL